MGRAERGMRRLFAVVLILAIAASLSWIAVPLGGRLLDTAFGGRPADGSVVAAAEGAEAATPAAGGGSDAVGSDAVGSDAGPPVESPAPPDALALPPATGYVWPIKGARLTTYFVQTASGTMMLGGQPVHDGVDLARPCGWPIAAAHDGRVIYAGRRADPYLGFSGPMQPYYDELARRKLSDRALPIMVVIDDGNGLVGVYAHLGKATVKAGQIVKAGAKIGYEGATGNATGCHLHYSLYLGDGPWVRVAWSLVTKWNYPLWMRLRIDPLLYLPADSPDAAHPRAGLMPPADPPHYVAPAADLPSRIAY